MADPPAATAAPAAHSGFAARKAKHRAFEHTVVKCALASRVKLPGLREVLERLVDSVSRRAHKASLVLGATIVRCLADNAPLPPLHEQSTFIACFKVGEGTRAAIHPAVQATWDAWFDGWPPTPGVGGDSNVINAAADTLKTALANTCVFAFDARQRAHVKRRLKAAGLADADVKSAMWPTLCAINGWTCRTPIPAVAAAVVTPLVAAERVALGLAADVNTEVWRAAHVEAVVRYYAHVLRAAEGDADARRFSLAPIHEINRMHVTIDKTVLASLITAASGRGSAARPDGSDGAELWAAAFDLRGLRSGGWARGATVQTDGVSLSVHYERPRPDGAPPPKKKRRAPAQPTTPSVADDAAVFAVDPGRRTLMFGVWRDSGGVERRAALSRGAYYHGMGKRYADARRARWLTEEAAAYAALADVSPKSAAPAGWRAYLAVVIAHHAALWRNKACPRWGREALHAYIAKMRTLDRWLNATKERVSEGGTRPVHVAYGGAQFSPTGHGEVAAPTTASLKRVRLAFGAPAVTLVDEFCTTKCCAACGARGVTSVLQNVFDQREAARSGRWRAVRGLKRCASDCCSFLDRDANAAFNIRAAFVAAARGEPRPRHLARDNAATAASPTAWWLRVDQRGGPRAAHHNIGAGGPPGRANGVQA